MKRVCDEGGCTRGRSPLVGGAAARGVTTVLVGARRVAAWGEPARPGFPLGETEKGDLVGVDGRR